MLYGRMGPTSVPRLRPSESGRIASVIHPTHPGSSVSSESQHPTLTRDEVAHLAHLARLDVSEEELARYGGQLSIILTSVARVTEVASADIVPTTHAVPLTNVYRDDVVIPGLTRDAVLSGAPATESGRFRVPQILGEVQ